MKTNALPPGIDESTLKHTIVALDTPSLHQATEWVQRFAEYGCAFKVGAALILENGLSALIPLQQAGANRIFLDLKFHDIPHAVGLAVKTAADHGIWMMTIHTSGGSAMMIAAREAAQTCSKPPMLMGVTVLTSLNADDLNALGIPRSPKNHALRLAKLAAENGLDGVIASPHEARAIRQQSGSQFIIVTPGARLPGDATQDQQRSATPQQALQAGASYVVMGRSLTK
ncbi:MAG: orotidine-5'-phosphate decarboxylase [Fimbriimonadia bacterium]|nr:orotidine-5'-phosphate decarboxylase [Fimbriimonadia bacterium]